MAIPDKIKIERVEDYRTHYLGLYDDGKQFMAFVVATLPEIFSEGWQRHKRWYAVLHTFDNDGNHLGTDARFAGTTADGQEQVWDQATLWHDEMIESLGPIEWSDIVIRQFSMLVDGYKFGLMRSSYDDEDSDEEDEDIEYLILQPNDLVFSEPWDGDYST